MDSVILPRDRNIRFPGFPRLVEDLDVFEMPHGLGIQIHGTDTVALVRGTNATASMRYVLSAMTGESTFEQIVSRRPAELKETTVTKLLWMLHLKGLITDGPLPARSLPDGPKEAVAESQLTFWGRHSNYTGANKSGIQIQNRIKRSRILLIASGTIGMATYELLSQSGFEDIFVIPWNDNGTLSRFVSDNDFQPRGLSRLETTHIGELVNRVSSDLVGVDLILAVTKNASAPLYEALNRIALNNRIPLLRSDLSGETFEIGPMVIPYSSGCYSCMTLREASVDLFPIEKKFRQEDLANDVEPGRRSPHGEAIAFAALAAGLVAGEAIRVTTGIAPARFVNAVLSTHFLTGDFKNNEFLRVPRCPDCYQSPADHTCS